MTTLNQSLTANTTAQEFIQEKRTFKIHWSLIVILAIGALILWISPVDLIPDVIIGLGQVDDVLVACIPIVSSYLAIKQRIADARNS